jgi:hypothetical protein
VADTGCFTKTARVVSPTTGGEIGREYENTAREKKRKNRKKENGKHME